MPEAFPHLTCMKLIADRMLGSLAKKLRLLGLDVLYPSELEDRALISLAIKEGRVLLTRDKELYRSAVREGGHALLITSVSRMKQIQSVIEGLKIKDLTPFTRCSLCNTPIYPIEKAVVRELVPETVYFSKDNFWWCPKCRKAYWEGSHWQGIERLIEHLRI